ncbi:MAG: antibiotic biosynthesis monooxygenase [Acidobacteria bacterium]|nr:antibiotic biosynthesis monooxygenase [Acidobacteriota bacterium]
MYMRLLYVKVRTEAKPLIRQFYEERVMSPLQDVAGCRFAGLIQSPHCPEELVSMTLWDTREQADAFRRSDMFRDIMTEVERYLAESDEWNVQLSDDLVLQVAAAPDAPVIKSYALSSQSDIRESMATAGPQMFLRLVSMRVAQGKTKEFREIYETQVIPELHQTRGCRCACLLVDQGRDDELLSVTLWDSRQDAEDYERSGRFAANLARVQPALSRLYHWKMALEKGGGRRLKTSEDVQVESYTMVTGRRLR